MRETTTGERSTSVRSEAIIQIHDFLKLRFECLTLVKMKHTIDTIGLATGL